MSISITDKDPKTYIILGCHHSGTSFLAKALHDQGIAMGTEPSAHYENLDALKVNGYLMGGDVFNPPEYEEIMSKDDGPVLDFIEKYKAEKWGFKDPRTSLTADKWLANIDGDCYIVAIFRKPERTVKSLAKMYKRDDLREIVDYYNEQIINSIKKFVEL